MSEPPKRPSSLGYERQFDERVDDGEDGSMSGVPLTALPSAPHPQSLPMNQHPVSQPQMQYLPGPVIAQPIASHAYGQSINYPTGAAMVQPNYLDRIPVALPVEPNPDMSVWSDDICDCFDNTTSCCWACWLPPYRWALTLSRANLMKYHNGLCFYGSLWLVTVILFLIILFFSSIGLLCVIGFIGLVALATVQRGRIRRKYRIDVQGGCFVDCVIHTCCCCCAIAQEARHVDRTLQLIGPSPHLRL